MFFHSFVTAFNLTWYDMNTLSSGITTVLLERLVRCSTCLTWMLRLMMWYLAQNFQIRKYFWFKPIFEGCLTWTDMNTYSSGFTNVLLDRLERFCCSTCLTRMLWLMMWFLIQSFRIRKYFDLNLWITTNFHLTPIENLNYSYFKLKKAWNDFDVVELQITHVWINHVF